MWGLVTAFTLSPLLPSQALTLESGDKSPHCSKELTPSPVPNCTSTRVLCYVVLRSCPHWHARYIRAAQDHFLSHLRLTRNLPNSLLIVPYLDLHPSGAAPQGTPLEAKNHVR
jgi:hypothetical protein